MRYTVWNRGSLVGETDLGFARSMGGIRCGWFHPAPGSDRVMRVVCAVSPALRAVVHRELRGGSDAPGDGVTQRGTTERADLAEAFQHLDGLALELRRADGSVVPVVDIGIQDMVQLVELALSEEEQLLDDPEPDGIEWDADDGMFTTVDLADESEPPLGDDDLFGVSGDDDVPAERYQIVVTLLNDDALP